MYRNQFIPQLRRVLIALTVGLCTLAFARAASAFTFTTIDEPSATDGTFAEGINSPGDIVGYYENGVGSGIHGFLLSHNGTFTSFDVPGSAVTGTMGFGIDDPGEVVGTFTDDVGFGEHGFFLSKKGNFTTIDEPNAVFETDVYGINAAGEIVGTFGDDTGSGVHGFTLDKKGNVTSFDDPAGVDGTEGVGVSNDSGNDGKGEIVGFYYDGLGEFIHGYLRAKDGTFTNFDVPGATGGTMPSGISPPGNIVGTFKDGTGSHGFLLDKKGNFTTINVPGAEETNLSGINAQGQLVGFFTDSMGATHGFVANP
jgi:hypothetical protein